MDNLIKLIKNPWSLWGFKDNPFSTNALTLIADPLPISQAFVGRTLDSPEAKHLLRILQNPRGGCGIIEGDIGVGKTTLVNYHRYLWEQEAEKKLLTPAKEISVYGRWEAKDLLIAILGHLSNKVLCILDQREEKKSDLLQKIQMLHEIFYQESLEMEGSAFGFGIGYGKQSQINVPDIPEGQLVFYLMDMVKEIKKLGYEGVFLHFDNLELLSRRDLEKSHQLFEEIRDLMQLPDVYYVFVAQRGFYSQIIAPLERVRSIMGAPVQVPPLTCQETVEAINLRYQLLSINPGKEVRPVEDSFIMQLHKLYQGKMRFILDSLSKICTYTLSHKPRTLKDREAEKILLDLIRVKANQLSPQELEVLEKALELGEFTNTDLSRALGIKPPNISRILNRLWEINFIYLSRKQGQKVYYQALEELRILTRVVPSPLESQTKNVEKKSRQDKIIDYLQKNKKMTTSECQFLLGISTPTARKELNRLVDQGKVKKMGKKKGCHYILVEER